MKVAVVDDSMEDRELLAGTAEETLCALGQGQTFMQLFPSGEMLLKDFQPGKYELVFLDIFLEEGALNGIGTAERLRALDSRVKLVFVTTSNDFASESYAVRADGYLLKPISRKALEGLLGRMLAAKEELETPVTLPDGQTVPARHSLYHLRGTLCHPDAARRAEPARAHDAERDGGAAARLPWLCGLQQGHTGSFKRRGPFGRRTLADEQRRISVAEPTPCRGSQKGLF